MFRFFALIAFTLSIQIYATVTESILPSMDAIYCGHFARKLNKEQKELMLERAQEQKLRIMTYNMLYNAKEAEKRLLPKHRWELRKHRLLEYLSYAQADIIGSQELQTDQVQEVMSVLGPTYCYFGEKTRQNEGRSDTNAIFYKKERLELLSAKTIPYNDDEYENAFTYCTFRDKLSDKKIVILNTKLSFSDPNRRLSEAIQLNQFASSFSDKIPMIVLGDFNIFPFFFHKKNIYFDEKHIVQAIEGKLLKDSRSNFLFGHFGPCYSINNSILSFKPFAGAQLPGFVPDRIFVNNSVNILLYSIDPTKVDGEFPSDHFPIVVDVVLN